MMESASPSVSMSTKLDPTSKSANISLVVLMGLPASGKSTLAKNLEKHFCLEWRVVLVSFDNFIPLCVQSQITQDLVSSSSNTNKPQTESSVPNDPSGMAKTLRKKFLFCVEVLVKVAKKMNDISKFPVFNAEFDSVVIESLHELKSNLCSLESLNLVPDEDLILKMESLVKEAFISDKKFNLKKTLIVVDDNNYYHSMRNDFYQIAKEEEVGFCVIYCKAPLKICLARNSVRDSEIQVPPQAIIDMSLKFEEPNPMQNSCDTLSIQIDTKTNNNSSTSENCCCNSLNVALLEQVISSTLLHPLMKNEDRTEEIERERRICSENEAHQADLILRKWISKRLNLDSLAKGLNAKDRKDGMSSFKKNLSKDLNLRKKLTLEKLKNGELKVCFNISEDLQFRDEIISMFENIHL